MLILNACKPLALPLLIGVKVNVQPRRRLHELILILFWLKALSSTANFRDTPKNPCFWERLKNDSFSDAKNSVQNCIGC